MDLQQLVIQFSQRPDLAAKTRQYYATLLNNFLWYARHRRWPAAELITREHLRDFLGYVATETYRWPETSRSWYKKAVPATVHHYGKALKSFFNWAEDEEYLDHNPAEKLKLGSPHYKEIEPYSDDEVGAMLDLCEQDARYRYRYLGTRNQAIISLFVATGLRLEELCGIELSHFDPGMQQISVLGKGAKRRTVPLSTEARKALKRYLQLREPGGEALWKTDDGQPMSMHSVKTMVTRLKRRAGLDNGGGAHRFRHYFATRYLEAGGDTNSLRLLLGHATLAMVLRYSGYVDVLKALASHQDFSPLDRLVQRRQHSHPRRQDYRLELTKS